MGEFRRTMIKVKKLTAIISKRPKLKSILATHLAATRVAIDERRLQRLIKTTPLLDDYKYRYQDLDSMLITHQRFRVCAIKGHIWELESYEPGRERKINNPSVIGSIGIETTTPTYNLKCIRCFPHMHSKMAVRSAHVFN